MRLPRQFSVCQLAISVSCVALLFVFGNSVRSQEDKKDNPHVRELKQQRLAVLEEIRDTAKRLFANAMTSFHDVCSAERDLLAARIAYTETREDRIKACDEAIEGARQWLEIIKARKAAARDTSLSTLKAQAFLLETQIARENAAAGE